MAAPFDRAWTRQPQVVSRIRPEYKPFSCYLPSAGDVDAHGAGAWAALPRAVQFGEVFGVSDYGSVSTFHPDSNAVIPAGSNATIVIVVADINYASTAPGVYTGYDGPGTGSGEFDVYYPYGGDDRTYFRWGGVTEGVDSISVADPIGSGALSRHVYVLSVGPAGMAIYRDGAKLASNSATPTRAPNPVRLSLGAKTQSISLFVALATQLPDALNLRISVNPWQLFTHLRRPIFSGFAAGGGASVLTLTANTTSSASILKSAKAQRQASITASAAIAKAAVSSKAAAVTSSATLARSAKLIRSATAVASAAVSKLAAAIRSAAATATATLATIKAKLLTLTASVTSSATARRAVSATRAATSTAAGTLAKAVTAAKAASTAVTATVGKAVATTKSASIAAMATIATVKAKLLTLAANITTSAAVSRTVSITRSATSTAAGAVAKAIRITRSATTSLQATLARAVTGGGLIEATRGYVAVSIGAARVAYSTAKNWIATR